VDEKNRLQLANAKEVKPVWLNRSINFSKTGSMRR